MQYTSDVQDYALGWRSGGTAEEDPASVYFQGQDGSWDSTMEYSGALCSMGAQAYLGDQEEQWASYGAACGGCYETYAAGVYGAGSYSYGDGCGSYGLTHGCVLNLDQYSDASDGEDEKEPEEKKAPSAKLAAEAALAPRPAAGCALPKGAPATAGVAAPAPAAEAAEPAPEPMHAGARGTAPAPAAPVWEEGAPAEAGAVSPQTAGPAAEEVGSTVSEPEAEASGPEQEPPLGPRARAPAAAAHLATGADTAVVAAESGGSRASWQAEAVVVHGRAKLKVSNTSWAAQQRARRASVQIAGSDLSDAEVVRRMKSILNKLTIEKFSVLYQKLVESGIKTTGHAEALIHEVFEKATMQHHFVDMYADLCAKLQEHFESNPISDDSKFSFRRLLLNECQASFERNLAPPAELQLMEHEERTLLEFQYKTRMIGNIRFVGALLTRKMLAGKVLFAIIEELLACATPEALESLAVLLTVVGPTFDTPDWQYYKPLSACFQQVKAITQKASCNPRARCLLRDLLDLRARSWQDSGPKRCEGPTTLEGVAQQAAAEGRTAAARAAAAAVGPAGAAPPRAACAPRPPRSQGQWQPREGSWQPLASPPQGRRPAP